MVAYEVSMQQMMKMMVCFILILIPVNGYGTPRCVYIGGKYNKSFKRRRGNDVNYAFDNMPNQRISLGLIQNANPVSNST